MIERTFIATEEDFENFSNNNWAFVGTHIIKHGAFDIPFDKCSLRFDFQSDGATIELQKTETNRLYNMMPFRLYAKNSGKFKAGVFHGYFTLREAHNVLYIKVTDIFGKATPGPFTTRYVKIVDNEFISIVQNHLVFVVLYFGRFMCDKKVRIVETWKPRKGNKGKTRVKIDRDCEYRIMHLNEIKTIYPNAKREGAGKGKGKPWKEGRDIATYYRNYKSPRYKNITGRHPVKGYHAGPKNTNQKPIVVKVINEGKGFNRDEVITIL